MVEEKTSKKKQLILAGIGLAFLLVLVIGATYAYFQFTSQNDFKDPATIEGSMGELGAGVSLTRAEDSTLTLNLSAADMLLENAQTYYASGSETPKTIATVKVTGAGYYNCTYTLEVTKTATSTETDMYERFQNGYTDKSTNQIWFTINDTTYDFNTSNLFDANGKLTYTGTLETISSAEEINLTANMVIVNSADINQTYLNGTDVSISINATEFNCSLVDETPVVDKILKTYNELTSLPVQINTTDAFGITNYYYSIDGGDYVESTENTYTFDGLESNTEYTIKSYVVNGIGIESDIVTATLKTGISLEEACTNNSMSNCLENASGLGIQSYSFEGDDLYRYVGDQGNTGINNYICLGSTTCASGDNNMYRIIGINPTTNELKVIKETRLSFTDESGTVTNTFKWGVSGAIWEQSDLYNTLNITWLESISFADLIVAKTWNIGDVSFAKGYSKSTIIPLETATQSTTPAKVGALSATDYVMAYTEEGDWTSLPFISNYRNNWINSVNNNWEGWTTSGNQNNEWTMSRGTSQFARHVYTSGVLRMFVMTTRYAARPTFFLTSELQYVSGEGTIDSPFIVQAPTN